MTVDRRTKTVGSLVKSLSPSYRLLNSTAWSRIHWRAFSRLPAAIRLELDECSFISVLELLVPAPLLPLEWPLSFDVECKCIDAVRPHRAGFNEAKNDDVFELDPKRERDDDEPDEPALPLAATIELDEVDGVLRPDEPISNRVSILDLMCVLNYSFESFDELVDYVPSAEALLINSCMTDDDCSE